MRTATSATRNAIATPASTSARLAPIRLCLLIGLEQRVDEGGDGGEFRDRDQHAQDQQRADEWHQPELLALARKSPQISQQIQHQLAFSVWRHEPRPVRRASIGTIPKKQE